MLTTLLIALFFVMGVTVFASGEIGRKTPTERRGFSNGSHTTLHIPEADNL